MLVVAKAIVFLVAIFFLVLGAAALVRPRVARAFLLGFANTAVKHYAELLARILVGGSLMVVARHSAYPTALSAFGWQTDWRDKAKASGCDYVLESRGEFTWVEEIARPLLERRRAPRDL